MWEMRIRRGWCQRREPGRPRTLGVGVDTAHTLASRQQVNRSHSRSSPSLEHEQEANRKRAGSEQEAAPVQLCGGPRSQSASLGCCSSRLTGENHFLNNSLAEVCSGAVSSSIRLVSARPFPTITSHTTDFNCQLQPSFSRSRFSPDSKKGSHSGGCVRSVRKCVCGEAHQIIDAHLT